MDWKAGEGSIRVFAQLRWACPLTLVTNPSISPPLGHWSYEFIGTSELRVKWRCFQFTQIYWKLVIYLICICESLTFLQRLTGVLCWSLSDMSSTAFIEPKTVMEFIRDLLNKELSRSLTDADRIKVGCLNYSPAVSMAHSIWDFFTIILRCYIQLDLNCNSQDVWNRSDNQFVSLIVTGSRMRLWDVWNCCWQIKKALRGVKVEVTHRGSMRRKYRISGLTNQATNELEYVFLVIPVQIFLWRWVLEWTNWYTIGFGTFLFKAMSLMELTVHCIAQISCWREWNFEVCYWLFSGDLWLHYSTSIITMPSSRELTEAQLSSNGGLQDCGGPTLFQAFEWTPNYGLTQSDMPKTSGPWEGHPAGNFVFLDMVWMIIGGTDG